MTTEMRRLKGSRGEIGRGAESRGGLEEQRGDEKRGVGHCRASHRGAEIRGGGNLLIRRRRASLLPPCMLPLEFRGTRVGLDLSGALGGRWSHGVGRGEGDEKSTIRVKR